MLLQSTDMRAGMSKPKTVLVTGNFNILHAGHLRLFKFAKDCGGKFLVGVNSDKMANGGSYVDENLRLECVQNSSWVDEAFLVDEPIETVIERIQPDIVVKGKEYELTHNPELTALKKYGGKLLFSSGEIVFSSIDLVQKSFSRPTKNTIVFPIEYLERHNITIERLLDLLKSFSKKKICVIGDLIVDEYITCQPLGMSQEDPTIVVTPLDSIRFIGGAGIVSAHAAGLGAEVNFLTVAGEDDAYKFANNELVKFSVNAEISIDASRPTTLKQRYRSQGKTLLRVSHLHQSGISLEIQKKFLIKIENIIKESDLLVFSDFNYGCLPQSMVELIIAVAKRHNVMLAADSQSSSQMGDISRFCEMDLICPTEREARIAVQNREDGLIILTEALRKKSSAKNILLKLGEEGVLIHAGESNNQSKWLTDRIGALNQFPKDVSGAGDSLLITSALTMASGGSIWEAAILGSIAAGIQVGRIGNIPLTSSELFGELSEFRH